MTLSWTRTPPVPAGPGTCRRCRRRHRAARRRRNARRSSRTWALYGATTSTSACPSSPGAVLVGPVRADQQPADLGHDHGSLLGAAGRVAVMVNGEHPHARRLTVKMSGRGATLLGAQPALVGQPGHVLAYRGMHPVRAIQEVAAAVRAACGGHRPASPAPTRRPVRGGVPWLTWGSCCGSPSSIRFLAAAGHRNGVGQAELAGLLDHQQVEASRVHSRVVGEIPCGAADYASRRSSR